MKSAKYLLATFLGSALIAPAYAEEPQANAPQQGRLGALIVQADTNQDGQLTLAEAQATWPTVTQEVFNQYDRNGDGVVSRDDRPETPGQGPRGEGRGMGERLRAADANADGKVTLEELRVVHPNLTEEQFTRFDTDGNGYLDPQDRPQRGPGERMERFRKADTDGNGEVTLAELTAVEPDMTQERFTELDRNGDGVLSRADAPEGPRGPGPGPQGEGQQARHLGLQQLQAADANSDGQVTYAEVTAAKPGFPEAAFKRMDRNGDGVLTQADKGQGGPGRGPQGGAGQ